MSEDLLSNGFNLMEKGDPMRAIDRIDLYLKENPNDPDALCARGICYLRVGEESKGKRDILLADRLGSNAASEFIDSNNIKRDVAKIKDYNGIKGWLKFFCVAESIGAALSMTKVFDEGIVSGFIIFTISAWQASTAIFLIRKSKYAVLNVKIFLSFVLIMAVFLIYFAANTGQGITEFLPILLYAIPWFIYFFKSERVRVTYGTR
jgi:hypothetical protein